MKYKKTSLDKVSLLYCGWKKSIFKITAGKSAKLHACGSTPPPPIKMQKR
jgi:hypothetical protein